MPTWPPWGHCRSGPADRGEPHPCPLCLAAMKEGKRTGLKALLDASNLSGKDITAGRIAFTAAPRSMRRPYQPCHERRRTAPGDRCGSGCGRCGRTEPSQHRAPGHRAHHCPGSHRSDRRAGEGTRRRPHRYHQAGTSRHRHCRIAPGGNVLPAIPGHHRPRRHRQGSCRSISGFNMYEALQYAQDLLIQFGGHTMAAGFSVKAENIEALRQRLLDYAAAT